MIAAIESHQQALIAANAALEKHAQDLIVMDVRALSSVTDFFILATAATSRQSVAIAEWVDHELTRCGGSVLHIEGLTVPRPARRRRASALRGDPTSSSLRVGTPVGLDGLSWVLVDCGDLVVHLFTPPAREFYQLERLWADAPRIPVASA